MLPNGMQSVVKAILAKQHQHAANRFRYLTRVAIQAALTTCSIGMIVDRGMSQI